MPGNIPVSLRMALGLAGGAITAGAVRSRIAEQEVQADLVNDIAKRDEFERQAATIAAIRGTQAQTVLGPGGVHPAFGYEVPVGSDQGMIRTAMLETASGIIGRRMAAAEHEHRKQAGVKTLMGVGALGGALALGGSGAMAGEGMRKADTLLNQNYARGRPIPQVKLGSTLVALHGGTEKEAGIGAIGAGVIKGISSFGKLLGSARKVGVGTPSAIAGSIKPAIRQGRAAAAESAELAAKKRVMRNKLNEMPTAQRQAMRQKAQENTQRTQQRSQQAARAADMRDPAKRRQIMQQEGQARAQAMPPEQKAQARIDRRLGAQPQAAAQASAPAPTPSAGKVVPPTQATPTPAQVTPAPAAPGGWEQKAKDWGNKYIVNPVQIAARNPWKSALAGVGVPAVAYGGYKATTGAVDVLQRHNPQYNYNLGGYQLPTSTGQYGYTQAPTMRY